MAIALSISLSFLFMVASMLALGCGKAPEDLSTKLATQEPLAVSQSNNVTVSIQYVLLYPTSVRVRLDINNASLYTLLRPLPQPGIVDSYIKDNDTDKKYLPAAGRGAMGKIGEAFSVSRDGTLTAAPGTRGSVFVYFDYVPKTVKQFDMVLAGFSLSDTGTNWETSFTNVPFRFDIAPPE